MMISTIIATVSFAQSTPTSASLTVSEMANVWSRFSFSTTKPPAEWGVCCHYILQVIICD